MGGPLELNRAVPGGRVEMFAIEDHDYPETGPTGSSFNDLATGEILRYDNAHDDDDPGWHHRHVSFGEDSGIEFLNVTAHIARFLQEVAHLTGIEDTDHD